MGELFYKKNFNFSTKIITIIIAFVIIVIKSSQVII